MKAWSAACPDVGSSLVQHFYHGMGEVPPSDMHKISLSVLPAVMYSSLPFINNKVTLGSPINPTPCLIPQFVQKLERGATLISSLQKAPKQLTYDTTTCNLRNVKKKKKTVPSISQPTCSDSTSQLSNI